MIVRMDWIMTEDQMPEPNIWFIGYFEDGQTLLTYRREEESSIVPEGMALRDDDELVSWMPMPERKEAL